MTVTRRQALGGLIAALIPVRHHHPHGWKLPSYYGLPPGLTLSPDGVLSGVPSRPGRYAFPVTVTDAAGQQAGQWFTLTIRPRVPHRE